MPTQSQEVKLVRLTIWFSFLLFLSGCATWSQHGITANENNRIRVAVLPVKVTAVIDKASDIMSSPPEMTAERDFINAQMSEVAIQLTGALYTKLGESEFINVVPITNDDLSQKEATAVAAHSWKAEDLQSLKQRRNVQAVLLVALAGYGKMKKEWLTVLIGAGIVEGVVQGVLAAKVVNNMWVGIALALEEIGQEILVWGGGSYLFNTHYSPVTLEAKLVSTTDATPVWEDTVFVSTDKDAINTLPEEDQKKREIQLKLTAKKAIAELVNDINNSAKRSRRAQ